MLQTAVALAEPEASDPGRELGEQIRAGLGGASPDAMILFTSPQFDQRRLLEGILASCRPALLVGCSSAGEFTSDGSGEGMASAVALRSTDMVFRAVLARGVRSSPAEAARTLIEGFRGPSAPEYPYRAALVLTDALGGYVEALLEQLTVQTAGTYQFVGGGAGDDARFTRTHVFLGGEIASDAAVALEILSRKPIGIGVSHGWQPASPPYRVTESDGMRVISLNAVPAVEVFEEHAEATGQRFDPSDPIPFFLHNVLGIATDDGYKLRVPLAVNPDGSVTCAAELPVGAIVHVMATSGTGSVDAAVSAAEDAVRQLGPHEPRVALFFDCAATRLRMGREFGLELAALRRALGGITYVGCNSYGQIARTQGQFSGFHNCTAVVCVLPE